MWLPQSPILCGAREGEGAELTSGCRESGGAVGGSGGGEGVVVRAAEWGGGVVMATVWAGGVVLATL